MKKINNSYRFFVDMHSGRQYYIDMIKENEMKIIQRFESGAAIVEVKGVNMAVQANGRICWSNDWISLYAAPGNYGLRTKNLGGNTYGHTDLFITAGRTK
jgi:hypothetical protein